MLAEFAITPDVFEPPADEEQRREWLRCLDRLADRLFPPNDARPVMISNMCGGGWMKELDRVFALCSERDRSSVRDFKKFLREISVIRNQQQEKWPQCEAEWVQEASALNSQVKIDQVITSPKAKLPGSSRTLVEVLDRGFWSDVSSTRLLRMELEEQAQLLGIFAEKFQWVAIYSPHFHPSDDGEISVVNKFLTNLTSEANRLKLTLFINCQRSGEDDCNGSERRLKEYLAAHERVASITVASWDKLLDRLIFGGDFVETSEDCKALKPRAAVSVCHFYCDRDRGQILAPTPWSLLSKSQISDLWDSYDPFSKKNKLRRELSKECKYGYESHRPR